MVETTSDLQPKASKRAFGRWMPDETAALIEAWAPLYNRRRRGARDAWVPLCIRGRARSSRALVTEDWRAVACAVNSYRAVAGLGSCRTYVQCKNRVEHLRRAYDKGRLEAPLSHALHGVWGAAAVGGRGGPPAGDACGSAPTGPGAYAGAAAYEDGPAAGRAAMDAGFAAAAVEAHGGEAAGAAAAEGARGGSAMGEDVAAAAWDAPSAAAVEDEELGSPGGAAATDLLGGPIPKRPRSAFSGTGRASPPVKEELVQRANARRGAADEGRGSEAGNGGAGNGNGNGGGGGGEAGNGNGGAGVDGIAAALAGHLGGALGAAGGSADAAVVTALADVYKQLTIKRLDLERERVAAEATRGAGRRKAVGHVRPARRASFRSLSSI